MARKLSPERAATGPDNPATALAQFVTARMSSSRRRRSGSSPSARSPCSARVRKLSNSAVFARKARAKTSSAGR
ncbi:hypothetical protein [Nonomuraea rubra]|uniref:hypothetical protein n=1 Tax=Nonomuraea rubra TaxID=46180 RepID=UPI003407F7F1